MKSTSPKRMEESSQPKRIELTSGTLARATTFYVLGRRVTYMRTWGRTWKRKKKKKKKKKTVEADSSEGHQKLRILTISNI